MEIQLNLRKVSMFFTLNEGHFLGINLVCIAVNDGKESTMRLNRASIFPAGVLKNSI